MKDLEDIAEYNSAAPGTRYQRRLHPDTGTFMIVQSGQVTGRFETTGEFVGSEGDILYAAP
ncbi:MAG TPA: hypothetical protein VNU44_09015 [Bryobacteraceae bacterium]|nr:hypothetical protein [Bryobacteraceae bacterium]